MNEISEAQYELIRLYLPVQRGNVRISNLTMINAVLHIAENDCKWRALPPRFGNWRTIYTRLRRWAEAGVLDRLFAALQEHRLIRIRVECLGLDSTSVKVHPDGTGGAEKRGLQAIGKSRGGWSAKVHLVAADTRTALTFSLSGGQAHDAPEGRALLRGWKRPLSGVPMLMDRAYEGEETRQLVLDLGFEPVAPPKMNRKELREYDRDLYKRRNEVEKLFRRLKGYRRIFSRFEKLDLMFRAFLNFVLIADMLKR
ncbi:IS5 family transposase [Paenirhodobacter populi]|uniref:IS5 family transposase n=1 Tax=Paenirhodobacter populi TaxID=2306993 RepID=A0A443JAE6_9RHOB|nr:IS5 family transposase [Sinirhodobacter populi]RWR05268.1 IS5 family transposase [Sinirhodobacter populi]RWR17503.1 IS5 family transposase [Sinirhodobacter populi]